MALYLDGDRTWNQDDSCHAGPVELDDAFREMFPHLRGSRYFYGEDVIGALAGVHQTGILDHAHRFVCTVTPDQRKRLTIGPAEEYASSALNALF